MEAKGDTSLIVVGQFAAAFGVRGWIKLHSYTEPAENILNYQPWLISSRTGWKVIKIKAATFKGNALVVQLPDCNNRETAKTYTNKKIAVKREQFPKLPKEAYYWADLIGMTVITTKGVNIGKVDRLLETGANDVLVVKGKGQQEQLIPYVKTVIKKVDTKEKIITIEWE